MVAVSVSDLKVRSSGVPAHMAKSKIATTQTECVCVCESFAFLVKINCVRYIRF